LRFNLQRLASLYSFDFDDKCLYDPSFALNTALREGWQQVSRTANSLTPNCLFLGARLAQKRY